MKTNVFDTVPALNEALVEQFSAWIEESLAQFDTVHILLSGGSTPQKFYELLSEQDFPWDKLIFGLVDERYVVQSDEHSNEAMIRATMSGIADRLNLIPMVIDLADYTINLTEINKLYQPFFERTDITLLGMGADGHTASIFPGDPQSNDLMSSSAVGVFYTTAPQIPHERITCSPLLLEQSRHGVILIHGEEKSRIFNAKRHIPLPIDRFHVLPNFEHYISRV